MAFMVGDPIAACEAAEEGRDLADAIGDRLDARQCRWVLGLAQWASGELAGAVAQLRDVVAEADAAHDVFWRFNGLFVQAQMLAYGGDVSAARAAANAAIERAAELSPWHEGLSYVALAVAVLAAGDTAAADDALAAGWHHISVQPAVAAIFSTYVAQAALARGDLTAARSWADEAVAANGNVRRAAGPHSLRPSATSSDWSAKGSPTTTSRRGFSSHRAPCKPTSPTSTPTSA